MRAGYTRNISSGGVLFTAGEAPQRTGDAIEYVITLHQGAPRPVSLRCEGMVLRCEPEASGNNGGAYRVAATMERYEFLHPE